jgi:4-diphosphocytidyl-2-C-methyl-D-erythritol kinase
VRRAVKVLPMADSSANSYRTPAPAKINLHLRVGPPTADGFHPLLSWMVTVALFDILEFTLVDGPPAGIALACDDPAIPVDASNLIVKTASALLETNRASGAVPSRDRGLSISLTKRIPVGAGLGGGSSDGALTLLALDHLLGLKWSAQQLSDFAARFGSDLSFFFHGSSSVCTGRGQIVNPIPIPKPRWAVLILPGIHMATPAVYRHFDEMQSGNRECLQNPPDWWHWTTLSALDLLPRLVNDLEAPAFSLSQPLANLHAKASAAANRIVRMSGSGSSLFTLFDEKDEAETSADQLRLKLGVDVRSVELCPSLAQFWPMR